MESWVVDALNVTYLIMEELLPSCLKMIDAFLLNLKNTMTQISRGTFIKQQPAASISLFDFTRAPQNCLKTITPFEFSQLSRCYAFTTFES